MSFLFDTSDFGAPRRARGAKSPKRGPPFFAKTVSEKGPIYIKGFVAQPNIGRIDGQFVCGDIECQGDAFDIVTEVESTPEAFRRDEKKWLIECAFCGLGQWVPAIKGYFEEPAEDEVFRFRDGRHEGSTISETAQTARGVEYIKWASEKHPRAAVRAACSAWVDATRADQ